MMGRSVSVCKGRRISQQGANQGTILQGNSVSMLWLYLFKLLSESGVLSDEFLGVLHYAVRFENGCRGINLIQIVDLPGREVPEQVIVYPPGAIFVGPGNLGVIADAMDGDDAAFTL